MLQCLQQLFIQNLVCFITSLIDRNNKVILATDINEYATDRKLPSELRRISMIDAFAKKFNLFRPALHATRSELIDRV